MILGLNSFDQWGVELGKVMAQKISPLLVADAPAGDLDSSTVALAARYRGR